MSDMVTGFQPGLAFTFDQVVPAMNATHDGLILRAGRARASGVSWEIYGPELAGVLARTRGGGSTRGPDTNGTFIQGLAQLAWLLAGSFPVGPMSPEDLADAIRSEEVHSEPVDDAVLTLARAAEAVPYPTLVIAYCQVRIRSESRS